MSKHYFYSKRDRSNLYSSEPDETEHHKVRKPDTDGNPSLFDWYNEQSSKRDRKDAANWRELIEVWKAVQDLDIEEAAEIIYDFVRENA